MTELQQYQPAEVTLLPTAQDVAIQRLGEWARSAQAAHGIAKSLVQTSFCPESFRNKPGEATAAILAGIEIGLQPMAALRSFDVIQGQAAPRAVTLRAVVQSHGHEVELVESTGTRCKMRGKRRGSSTWQEVTWTLDRAKALGVTGKPNWKNQPQAMLVARATSEIARLVASDAILGIAYSAEEIADGGTAQLTADTAAVTPPDTGTRRMSRARPVAAVPDPEPEPAVDEPDSTTPAQGITEPQLKKLHATYRDLGLDDRDERLADASQFLGRDVTSSSDLSKDEARRLIDYLEMRTQPPAPDGELFGGEPV